VTQRSTIHRVVSLLGYTRLQRFIESVIVCKWATANIHLVYILWFPLNFDCHASVCQTILLCRASVVLHVETETFSLNHSLSKSCRRKCLQLWLSVEQFTFYVQIPFRCKVKFCRGRTVPLILVWAKVVKKSQRQTTDCMCNNKIKCINGLIIETQVGSHNL
jgi:hypothetical protein